MCTGGPLHGACLNLLNNMEAFKNNPLPSKHIIYCTCPECHTADFHKRSGVDPGFEYLSHVRGETFTCRACDNVMRVTGTYIYGFVEN